MAQVGTRLGEAAAGDDAIAARHSRVDLVAHGESALSPAARAAIADPDNLVMASAASGYEIANKQRLGRLSGRIAQDLPNALREARIPVHALTLAHTIAAGLLPGPHRDPWDRLIMAQALTDDLTVVTVDPVFPEYALPICW